MKKLGIALIVVGVVWAIFAFNMNVTVTAPSEVIGSGAYAIKVPEVTVNNVGLMDQRRNHMIGAGVVFIAGVLLLAFSGQSEISATAKRVCPYCAESVSSAAIVCRFCHKDLPMVETVKDATEKKVPSSKAGPATIVYCEKCTAMNNATAGNCFRCGEVLKV